MANRQSTVCPRIERYYTIKFNGRLAFVANRSLIKESIVKNFLETQLGKEVDLTCEGATISGRITRIEGDVVWIEKEGVMCYVNIQKIVVVWEQRERKVQAPGFGARSL